MEPQCELEKRVFEMIMAVLLLAAAQLITPQEAQGMLLDVATYFHMSLLARRDPE